MTRGPGAFYRPALHIGSKVDYSLVKRGFKKEES